MCVSVCCRIWPFSWCDYALPYFGSQKLSYLGLNLADRPRGLEIGKQGYCDELFWVPFHVEILKRTSGQVCHFPRDLQEISIGSSLHVVEPGISLLSRNYCKRQLWVQLHFRGENSVKKCGGILRSAIPLMGWNHPRIRPPIFRGIFSALAGI